jgi:hypothetical protein
MVMDGEGYERENLLYLLHELERVIMRGGLLLTMADHAELRVRLERLLAATSKGCTASAEGSGATEHARPARSRSGSRAG